MKFPHIVNWCQWIWSSWPTFCVINSDLTFKRLDFKTLTITSRGKCASRLQKRNIHGKKVIRWLHNWFWGDFFYFYLRKSLTCSPQSAHITKIFTMTLQILEQYYPCFSLELKCLLGWRHSRLCVLIPSWISLHLHSKVLLQQDFFISVWYVWSQRWPNIDPFPHGVDWFASRKRADEKADKKMMIIRIIWHWWWPLTKWWSLICSGVHSVFHVCLCASAQLHQLKWAAAIFCEYYYDQDSDDRDEEDNDGMMINLGNFTFIAFRMH